MGRKFHPPISQCLDYFETLNAKQVSIPLTTPNQKKALFQQSKNNWKKIDINFKKKKKNMNTQKGILNNIPQFDEQQRKEKKENECIAIHVVFLNQ